MRLPFRPTPNRQGLSVETKKARPMERCLVPVRSSRSKQYRSQGKRTSRFWGDSEKRKGVPSGKILKKTSRSSALFGLKKSHSANYFIDKSTRDLINHHYPQRTL